MRLPKKFLPQSHCKKGNVLIIVIMATMMVGSFIVSSQTLIRNSRQKFRQIKKIQQEKQALILAKAAFNKLESIATDDFIATCKKDGKLYFYNVQSNEPQNLGNINLVLDDPTMHVEVDVNENDPYAICCCFQKNGLRKSLDECWDEIPHAKKEKIKQRWENLQSGNELSTDLFSPLVTQYQISDNNVKITLYNPFDRALKGNVSLKIEGCERITSSDDVHVVNNVPRSIEDTVNIDLSSQGTIERSVLSKDFTIKNVSVGNLCMEENLITNKGNYQVSYADLDESFHYKISSAATLATNPRKAGAWGKKSTTSASSPEDASPGAKTKKLPFFETKNWIQQLNACCFFCEKDKPYRILDKLDITDEDSINLRDYFWNHTIENPQLMSFNFNGTESYLKERFKGLAFFNSYRELDDCVQAILSHQPYPNAIEFLKQLKSYRDKFYLFENLIHRAETFTILSFCETTKCVMIVSRQVDQSERSWKVRSVEFFSEKTKFDKMQ